ncbi:MAG TPA: alkaline phosphatase family protein [Bryobacteraceae bacterium]|nr:alkaline phosphatase family protein [Bryobacteraceae bacterium]
MAEIQHLVVLMLENRSFDHMLGWLQSPNYQIDGVDGTQLNRDSTGEPVRVTNDANYSGDYDPDVAHDFLDVNQQIFGTKDVEAGMAPTMSGFVENYGAVSGSVAKSHRVMKCFDPQKIPVLTTLAQQYALCTRWFSSVPGPTLPNRAYAHGATSVGHVDMTINWWKESKTIYELLVDHGFTAKIYYTDSTIALTYGGMIDRQSEFFVPDFDAFFDDCKSNNLPNYCFLEPRYNATDGVDPQAASDQHPDHDVEEGETLIHDVFNAIRSNAGTWNSTLLVIVYDEHGGLFDHIPPPATVSPDGINSTDPFFAFDRLGVRVPAVLVSPYIEAGTIINDRVFDHASLAATAQQIFLGEGWRTNAGLTNRDRQANTFEGVVTRAVARAANEVDITGKHNQAVAGRTLTMADRALQQVAMPPSEHQQALAQVMASLAARPQVKRAGD